MNVVEYLRLAWRYRTDPLYCKFLAGRYVLDVGAGTGEFVRKDPMRFIGIEVDPLLVQECRKYKLNVICMNALNLSFASETFEAVHAGQFIEHLNPVDAVRFLKEAARVLQPGGIIFLTTPGVKNVWGTFSHVRPYPPDSFVKLLGHPTEGYVRGEELALKVEEFWGNRWYVSNRFLLLMARLLDLLLPPSNPIGWTILLRKSGGPQQSKNR